jgi:hypothetical protein
MNADTATPPTTPTIPAPAPAGGALPVVPAPGAATPPDPHNQPPAEPNALLDGTKKLWENVKAGKVGSPKVIALVLAVAAIIAAWWFLSYASKKTDSALWYKFDEVVTPEQANTFANEPSNVNTHAAKIAKLNDARLRRDAALLKMASPRLRDRQEAADQLGALRDEFADLAGQLGKDQTLKAMAFREAAEIEMGLVGVPKKDKPVMLNVKADCRGQLDKYAELLKKAADAIGPATDAGKQFLADADKAFNEDEAAKLYRLLGTFHAKFNNADPLPPPITTDPNTPKLPPGVGGTTPTTPGDTPKPPEGNPFEKK